MKIAVFLISIVIFTSCSKDPIINEIEFFEGDFRVDSIRQVTKTLSQVFTDPATITLRMHPETDTIEAFGEITIIEPGVSDNILIFSQSLYSYLFVKRFANRSLNCLDVSGSNYVAYWFPDLDKKRLTFWTLCGTGTYRTVLTVRELSKNRYEWTFIDASDLGLSNTTSALNAKELIYVTKL